MIAATARCWSFVAGEGSAWEGASGEVGAWGRGVWSMALALNSTGKVPLTSLAVWAVVEQSAFRTATRSRSVVVAELEWGEYQGTFEGCYVFLPDPDGSPLTPPDDFAPDVPPYTGPQGTDIRDPPY